MILSAVNFEIMFDSTCIDQSNLTLNLSWLFFLMINVS